MREDNLWEHLVAPALPHLARSPRGDPLVGWVGRNIRSSPMTGTELQQRNAERVMPESSPVDASASLGNGGKNLPAAAAAAHKQGGLATRSYSDLRAYNPAIKVALYGSCPIQEEEDDPIHREGGKGTSISLSDMAFFQQYNTVYREVEGRPQAQAGYYPCSSSYSGDKVLSRGGVGSWSLRWDPEVKRRGRLAGYRTIAMEAKMKSSMKRSLKWVKQKCASWLSSARTPSPDPTATATHA